VLYPLLGLLLLRQLVLVVLVLPHLLLWRPPLQCCLMQCPLQQCLIAGRQHHLHCTAQSLAVPLAAASDQQLALCCHRGDCQQLDHQLLLLPLPLLQLHCRLLLVLLHWSLPAPHDPLAAAAAHPAAACRKAAPAPAAAAAPCHLAQPQLASFCLTAARHPLQRPSPAQPSATAAALLLPSLLLPLPLPHPLHPSP
jgi:hypothetical protein